MANTIKIKRIREELRDKLLKVASFQCVFLNLQISKKIFQKTILNLKFKFPAKYTVIVRKFKFQAQDSFLEYFCFGDLKNESLFLKKATFTY